ncbi:MAG: argininosuccinate lyase [Rickettsiales bacterium]
MVDSTDNTKNKVSSANQMWGGQFSYPPDKLMAKINVSVDFDKILYRQDIKGSIAHAKMLATQGIIDSKDSVEIIAGLSEIALDIENGDFEFKEELEDIHMNIEAALKERIGDAAGRLHTARSRNDQVATDFRLYIRDAMDSLDNHIKELQTSLLDKAEENTDSVMPGFTHLQVAQPVIFAHHLLAYVEMLQRDRHRLKDARNRLNESPLGAAALAGTSFPIDRFMTAKELGFGRPMANSLDAVSDRDFAMEYLSTSAICALHLSRLAEEMVMWSSAQFAFISFSDAYSTGSSIMPQKRNPDAAELIRGKSGRMLGNMIALFTTMKSLPLAYNKDTQEDKEPVFDTASNISLCVQAMSGMVRDLTVNKENMKKAAGAAYSTATDLADWLVRELKMPFRNAHHVTARIVKLASDRKIALEELPLAEMQTIEPHINENIFDFLSVENSVNSRKSYGGTSPYNVKQAIAEARSRIV